MAAPKKEHWLRFVPEVSVGTLLTICSGCIVALGFFYTMGVAVADNDQTNKRQDADITRVAEQVAAVKAATDTRAEKLDTKIEEMNRNIVALMVAQGVKPAGGER